MEGQKMQPRAAGQRDRYVPVAGRGQALKGEGLGGHGGGGQQAARKVAPEKAREIAGGGGVERQARQDRHAAFAGEAAPALGIAGAVQPAVAVKVEAGAQAGVGAWREGGGVGEPALGQTGAQGRQGRAVAVPVEVGQKEHVRLRGDQDVEHGPNLGVAAPGDVAQHKARTVARQVGVEGGDAQRAGARGFGAGRRGGKRQQQGGQAGTNSEPVPGLFCLRLSAIIWAMRFMATPRMNRLAGRKAQAAIVQISVWGDSSVTGSKLIAAILTPAGIMNGSRNPSAMLKRASF